jgi:hypothetical protein
MGMDWLRGLVGASDQMVPAGQPLPGQYGPPQQGYAPPPQQGYAPPPAYGPPGSSGSSMGGYAPQTPQADGPPAAAWAPTDPSTWGGPPPAPAPGDAPPHAPGAATDPRVAELEARCAELRRDVDHLALFARTLLAMLEDKQLATEEQFQETLRKLAAKPPAT